MMIRDGALRVSKILLANPATESREINDSIIANSTILRHLKECGYDTKTLEVLIPAWGCYSLNLQLYGLAVSVDHTGRIVFFDKEEELPDEEGCNHGFVVRDIQGDNRFLCRECGDRFPRHPELMSKDNIFDRTLDEQMKDQFEFFRQGMHTFTEVIKKTQLSTDEFIKTIKKMFPPPVETVQRNCIGGDVSTPTVVSVGPERTSCPEEIEAFFGDPQVTVTDIHQVVQSTSIFPDIIRVDHRPEPVRKLMVVEIHFVDGTMQKVIMSENDLIRSGETLIKCTRSWAVNHSNGTMQYDKQDLV